VNVMDLIHSLKTALEEMAHIDPAFESYLEEVRSARISIQEAVQFTERYRDQIEFNPDRLEELRVRQSELNRLQKKYGRSVAELIEYQAFLDGELGSAESMDVELERLQSAIESQAEVLKGAAVALHNQRVASGERLSAEIVDSLKELGIPSGAFRVEVRWMTVEGREGSSVGGARSGGSRITGGWFDLDGKGIQCTENGCDEIRFFISTNKGEDPKPLSKIASGGEISRVMLSLKSILAKQQRLPVMIFDEIDTGISGAVSEKVGRRMRGLSSNCQIIAITHQPQIASQAHNHYRVEKVEDDERVITRIVPLSEEEHIEQVARLMSGEQLSVHAIESARQLVKSHQS
jgi:DNA repair protein RecN (Recombination protein N)